MSATELQPGERVRIVLPDSEYTGCRGAVTEAGSHEPGEAPLGYWVAIDGENGLARPFLDQYLVRLVGARVPAARAQDARSEQQRSA